MDFVLLTILDTLRTALMTAFPAAKQQRHPDNAVGLRAAGARNEFSSLPVWADFVEKLLLI